MSERVDLTALHPQLPGENAITWTGRLLSHAREAGTNRQCSIGYHGECSDRSGDTCRCLCHDDDTRWFTVEGHVEGGVFAITRVEQGKAHWPAVPGEPATIWAHWVMGSSEQDAKARALNKQVAVLGLEPVKPEHLAEVPGMAPAGLEGLPEKLGELLALRDLTRTQARNGVISHQEMALREQWIEDDLLEVWRKA